jgi:hypothetical protein
MFVIGDVVMRLWRTRIRANNRNNEEWRKMVWRGRKRGAPNAV